MNDKNIVFIISSSVYLELIDLQHQSLIKAKTIKLNTRVVHGT